MRVAVAGGTGVVGSLVVARLHAGGHEPVVLARATGVDLLADPAGPGGLTERLADVDVVVDVTSTVTTSARRAIRFFTATTGNLLTAGHDAGVRHHVLLSIVGIDVVPFGYYQGKLAQEHLVQGAPVPFTIVRATQFHEFAGQILERSSLGPVALVPQMLSAPIAADEVAAVLVELVEGEPQGHATPVRGPREEHVPDLARRLLRHRGSGGKVLALPLPGKAGHGMRSGALIPDDPAVVGTQTFDEWLAHQPGGPRPSGPM